MASVIIKIILFLIIFSVIVFAHEGGHCVIAKMSGIGVKEFTIGMGPTIVGFKKGETFYAIKAIPFGGMTIFEGDDPDEEGVAPNAFQNASCGARFATILAGPMMNFVLAFLLSLIVIGSVGFDEPVLYDVMDGYPAAEAGMQAGDRIISINGRKTDIYRDITMWGIYNGTAEAEIVYERDGNLYKVMLTPRYSQADGRALFGFRGPNGYTKGNPLQVIKYSLVEVRYWIEMTIRGVISMFTKGFDINDLAGPVGVADVVGDVYESSSKAGAYYVWINMLSLVVLISSDLGVMNLLPFPALDGGRLLIVLFEMITGRKPDQNVVGVINLVGAAFLLVLMVCVLFNDIHRMAG